MVDQTNKDEELVLVEVPEDIVPPPGDDQKPIVPDRDDKADQHDDDDDDDDDEERRVSHDAKDSGETDEQRRERRRAEKKRRRIAKRHHLERERVEMQRLRQENAELAGRMRAVEGRTVQQEGILLSNRQSQLEAQLREADSIIIQARAIGNHADSLEAEEVRESIKAELGQIVRARQNINSRIQTEQQAQQRPQSNQPPVDPVVKVLAQDWIDDNKWVLSNASAQVKVRDIDAALVAEGYNPKSIKFWNELSKRVGKEVRLSNDRQRDDDDDDDDDDDQQRGQHQQRGPSMSSGNGGGSSRRLKANEVLITPERKKAMMDAGAWEDPDKRKRMLKSFHEWDRNPANKQPATR